MPKNWEFPNTPSNGGWKNVVVPLITTGHQDV